jgi:hypothetical protein
MESLFPAEFWNAVAVRQREGQRKGQAIYNTAHLAYDRARWLGGSDCDPFYDDSKIGEFLEELTVLLLMD